MIPFGGRQEMQKPRLVERIINQNLNNYWEVSRDISWEIFVADGNALSDIESDEN